MLSIVDESVAITLWTILLLLTDICFVNHVLKNVKRSEPIKNQSKSTRNPPRIVQNDFGWFLMGSWIPGGFLKKKWNDLTDINFIHRVLWNVKQPELTRNPPGLRNCGLLLFGSGRYWSFHVLSLTFVNSVLVKAACVILWTDFIILW